VTALKVILRHRCFTFGKDWLKIDGAHREISDSIVCPIAAIHGLKRQ